MSESLENCVAMACALWPEDAAVTIDYDAGQYGVAVSDRSGDDHTTRFTNRSLDVAVEQLEDELRKRCKKIASAAQLGRLVDE